MLSIGDSFWVRDKRLCLLFLFYLEPHVVQIHEGPVLPLSLYLHMCADHVDLETLVFLLSSVTSGSYTLSASSSMGFPESWGERFDGDVLFRYDCSMVSRSLHIVWLWVSVFVPICYRTKLL